MLLTRIMIDYEKSFHLENYCKSLNVNKKAGAAATAALYDSQHHRAHDFYDQQLK